MVLSQYVLVGQKLKRWHSFQAEEVDIPWEYFAQANHSNPEGLSEEEYLSGFVEDQPEEIQAQAANGTFPIGRWKAFNTKSFHGISPRRSMYMVIPNF